MISDELQIGKAGEHIACADLILQGYNAFLADQGLPYDVLIDLDGHIKRVQVKATMKLSCPRKNAQYVYRFQMRKGRQRASNRTPISPSIVDYYAFVVLDCRRVAYSPVKNILGDNGMILQTIDFKSRHLPYPKECGRYFEDFSSFTP